MIKKISLAAVAALGLSALSAQASTVTVNYQDAANPFGSDNWYMPVTVKTGRTTQTVYAGQFAMASDAIGDFMAFCIEISQSLYNGRSYEASTALSDATVNDNIDRLFSSAYGLVTDALSAASFQLALWEIVSDSDRDLDLDTGSFSVQDGLRRRDSIVETTAQGYLDGLSTASTGLYSITYLTSDRSQDLVTAQLAPTDVAPVPLPAGGLLLVSAVAGFAGIKRFKKRAA